MFRFGLSSYACEISAGFRTCFDTAEDIIRARHAHRDHTHVYQSFDEEAVRRQARSIHASGIDHPLKAVPVSVKDAYGVEGFPTFGGGRTALPARWARDTGIIRMLRGYGVLLTGKTRMVELALGGLGHNAYWGAPVNPWDAVHDRVCGGSSCGAGVSLWDGTAAVALAADIAGSVRVPASMSGVVGFRPTKGLWNFGESYLGICPTLDGPGILTLSVADAAFFFEGVQGGAIRTGGAVPDGYRSLKGARIGVVRACFEQAQPDIAEVAHLAVGKLSEAGAEVVDLSFPEFHDAYELYMDSSIAAIECAAFVEAQLADDHRIHDPVIRGRLEQARAITATHYVKSLDRRIQLMKAAMDRWSTCDVFVTPTVPISPPRFVDIEDPADYAALNKRVTLMTNPINVLDLTALTMPVGKDALGMPVGLQLASGPHSDEALLRIALGAECVLGKPAEVLGVPPRLYRES